MIDYTLQYRERLDLDLLATKSAEWALFISAFSDRERVQKPFAAVKARNKHWLVHREYQFQEEELPNGDVFAPSNVREADFWREYEEAAQVDFSDGVVCIDATAFMRPHLAYILARLQGLGVCKFKVLYSDPERYLKGENTEFTRGPILQVRQGLSFEGLHVPTTANDLLILGIGYEDELIRRVADSKADARKRQLFGLPSLQPDMYQQSVLRAALAVESVGEGADHDLLFAPANDPFVTAQVLSDACRREKERREITNLYLSPLGTKPQLLGFTLFFLTELRNTASSMLFPIAERYARETAEGIARVWLYSFELPPA